MKVKLNAKYIESLRPTSKWKNFFDSEVKSFALRMSPAGAKSFVLYYRNEGKLRMHTIGSTDAVSLDEARDAAIDIKRAAHRGEDPAAAKKAARQAAKLALQKSVEPAEKVPESFSEICTAYVERYAMKSKRTWPEDRRILTKYVEPTLGAKKASDITRKEIRYLLDSLSERAPIQANRTLACVRKVFNWAVEKELVGASPCAALARPGEEKKRARVLNDAELRAVWATAEQEGFQMARFFKLLLFTLKRSGELRKARWSDIDWDQKTWAIPAEHSKNENADLVPLSAPAIDILKELRARAEADAKRFKREIPIWIFPNPRNRDGNMTNVQNLFDRVRIKSKVENWTGHDLRRTARSSMGRINVPSEIAEKLLNHAQKQMEQVYDHFDYLKPKRQALDKWARLLMKIVSGEKPESNVVPMHG